MNVFRVFILGSFLLTFIFTPSSNAQPLVLGQIGVNERVDYVLSRYLFTKDVELRTQIQEEYLSTNNDPSLVWKLKTFSAYDSTLSRNYVAAKRLLEEANVLKPNSSYASLVLITHKTNKVRRDRLGLIC